MGPGRPGIPGSPGLPIGPGSSSHCWQWSMLGAPEILTINYMKSSAVSDVRRTWMKWLRCHADR